MLTDIAKKHTVTQINLSKPYHKGSLLIDLKSKNPKSILEILPLKIKTTNKDLLEQDSSRVSDVTKITTKNTELDKQFIEQDLNDKFGQGNTLNFDKFLSPDFIFDSKEKVNYRDLEQIQVENISKINAFSIKTNKNSVDQEAKKIEHTEILSAKILPKIIVAPLHSKSRKLALINKNRSLVKSKIQTDKDRINKLKLKQLLQKQKNDLENFEVKTNKQNNNFNNFTGTNFKFKSPPKFNSKDIPDFNNTNSPKFKKTDSTIPRVNLESLNSVLHDSELRKKIRYTNKLKRYSVTTAFTALTIIFCTIFLTGNSQWIGQFGIKNVKAGKTQEIKSLVNNSKYEEWILTNNLKNYSPPGNDLDKDGLSNYDEFLIGSKPLDKNSCKNKFTDFENVLNLIDPVSCSPINFDNSNDVLRFQGIINIPQGFKLKPVVLPLLVIESSSSLVSIASSNGSSLIITEDPNILISSNSAEIMSDIVQ